MPISIYIHHYQYLPDFHEQAQCMGVFLVQGGVGHPTKSQIDIVPFDFLKNVGYPKVGHEKHGFFAIQSTSKRVLGLPICCLRIALVRAQQ